jgi:hypothetical protein
MIVPAVCDMTRAQVTSHETFADFMTHGFSNQTAGISSPHPRPFAAYPKHAGYA